MISQANSPGETGSGSALRWRMAFIVSTAIVLSYLDRQTLPWTLSRIHPDYPFFDQIKALFDSAFLIACGLIYLGGGWLAMNHGGPFTATGPVQASPPSAFPPRFAALHCYDNVRAARLPAALQNKNSNGKMWRLIDGQWSQDGVTG
jgi:hypothetical protein